MSLSEEFFSYLGDSIKDSLLEWNESQQSEERRKEEDTVISKLFSSNTQDLSLEFDDASVLAGDATATEEEKAETVASVASNPKKRRKKSNPTKVSCEKPPMSDPYRCVLCVKVRDLGVASDCLICERKL